MKLFSVKRGTIGRLLTNGVQTGDHFAAKDLVFAREELWADFCSVANGNVHPKTTSDMLTYAHNGWYVFAKEGTMGGESKYHFAVFHTNVQCLGEPLEVL